MATQFVKHGYWLDYSRSIPDCPLALPENKALTLNTDLIHRLSGLCTEQEAFYLTSALVVLITSASSRIFILVIHPLDTLWKRFLSWRYPLVTVPSSFEEAHDWAATIEGAWEDVSLGDFLPTALGGSPNGRPLLAVEISARLIMTVLLLGPPVLFVIASIFSSRVATDTVAQSNSPSCGEYLYDFESSRSSELFLRYEQRAEAQASLYGELCSGESSLDDGCKIFYKQSIEYSVKTDADCPFDGDVCEGGPQSAFSSTTGLVSGSVLGVNAANPFFFTRTMTCSPLVATGNYLKKGTSDQGEQQWEYWYGKSASDYTWANPVRESAWEIIGYSTGFHCSTPDSRKSTFEPISGFSAGSHPVTILFISSHSLFYPERRDDPVFPAKDNIRLPGEYTGGPLFYNNSTRAGILGCVDEQTICKTESGPCWTNGNFSSMPVPAEGRNATQEENVAYLLLLALDYSTSCGSVQFRGAHALDAQSKVAHIQSLSLAPKQWQVEAEKMSRTSLARTQLNVFDTVRGTAAAYEGYKNVLPTNCRGICGMVKFSSRKLQNVNLVGIVGITAATLIIFIISYKKTIAGEENLIAVWIWKLGLKPLGLLIRRFAKELWIRSRPFVRRLRQILGKAMERIGANIAQPLSERLLGYPN